MNLLELFKTQLDNATPLSLQNVNDMRQSRADKYSVTELQGVLKSARLDTDELVGHKIVYYLLQSDNKLDMLRLVDDEIQTTLSSLKYVRMAANYPVFTNK